MVTERTLFTNYVELTRSKIFFLKSVVYNNLRVLAFLYSYDLVGGNSQVDEGSRL